MATVIKATDKSGKVTYTDLYNTPIDAPAKGDTLVDEYYTPLGVHGGDDNSTTDAGGAKLIGSGLIAQTAMRRREAEKQSAPDKAAKLKLRADFIKDVREYQRARDAGNDTTYTPLSFDEFVINKYGKDQTKNGQTVKGTGKSTSAFGELARYAQDIFSMKPKSLGGRLPDSHDPSNPDADMPWYTHLAPGQVLKDVYDFTGDMLGGPTREENAINQYAAMRAQSDTRSAGTKIGETFKALPDLALHPLQTAREMANPDAALENIAMMAPGAGIGAAAKYAKAAQLARAATAAQRASTVGSRAVDAGLSLASRAGEKGLVGGMYRTGADAGAGALIMGGKSGEWSAPDAMSGAIAPVALHAAGSLFGGAKNFAKRKIGIEPSATPDLSAASQLAPEQHPVATNVQEKIAAKYGAYADWDTMTPEQKANVWLNDPTIATQLGVDQEKLTVSKRKEKTATLNALYQIDPEAASVIGGAFDNLGQGVHEDAPTELLASAAKNRLNPKTHTVKASDVKVERTLLPMDADIANMTTAEQNAALAASDAAIAKGTPTSDLHPLTHGPDAARRLKYGVIEATQAKNDAVLADKGASDLAKEDAKRSNDAIASEKSAMDNEALAKLHLDRLDPANTDIATPTNLKIHSTDPKIVTSMAEYANKEAMLGNQEPSNAFIRSFGSTPEIGQRILDEMQTVYPVSKDAFVEGVKSHLGDAKKAFDDLQEKQGTQLKSVTGDVAADGAEGAKASDLSNHVDYLLTKPGNPAAKAELADVLMKNPEVLIGAGLPERIARAAAAGSKVAQEEATKWINDRKNHPKIRASFVQPQ